MQRDISNRKTNIKVEFFICAGKLNFDEVTFLLGIEPTSVRSRNTFRLKEFAKDYWNLETQYENSLDINIQLMNITNFLVDKVETLNKICEKFDAKCGFCIVIKIENGEFPAMSFESDFIKFAASINADISFDPYFMSDCE